MLFLCYLQRENNLVDIQCLKYVSQVRVTALKFYKFDLHVGKGDNMHRVCRTGFATAYNVSPWYIDDLVKRVKLGMFYFTL